VPAPEELVLLSAPGIKAGSTSNNNQGGREEIFSYPMFRDLERSQRALAGLAAHLSVDVNVAAGGETREGDAMLVSGAYFDVLGVRPAFGRLIGAGDDRTLGGHPVAVLSHAYWKNELGADPDIVGRTLLVNGRSFAVIGVAPEGFYGASFNSRPLLFLPLTMRWALDPQWSHDEDDRMSYWLYVFGRRQPGRSLEETEDALNAVYRPLLRNLDAPRYRAIGGQQLEEFDNGRIELLPGARGQSSAPRKAGTPLALLLGTAALVLLIACLNIANLMLARGAARAGELAVRASIGASRTRLLRQLLVEAALLALLGALASLPMTLLTVKGLVAVLPVSGASLFSVSLDRAALCFTALAALATMLVFGVFPALQLARTQPMAALRGEAGQAGGSRMAARFRSGLAVAQIAFSMTALVLAGLFTQSLANLRSVDLGLDVDTLATFSLSPQRNGYTRQAAVQLFERLETELAAVPGVEAASASLVPVLTGSSWGTTANVQGAGNVQDGEVLYNQVGPDFFRTMGVDLLAGRGFSEGDAAGAPKVAVVNRAFLRKYGLPENAVGSRMSTSSTTVFDIEIVGIAPDTVYNALREGRPAQFYLPWRQQGTPIEMNFYVRAALAPSALLPQLREVVKRIDANLVVKDLRTVPDVIDASLGGERFVGALSAALASLATVLAALGLYGVLSYTLAQRMRELGLRLALGAAPRRLRAMLLRQVARMTAIGTLLGLVVAVALGQAAQSALFGLEGHDPFVLGTATFLLALVAFAAGYGPARRAARIDPMTALRHE
jgi:predicted permease